MSNESNKAIRRTSWITNFIYSFFIHVLFWLNVLPETIRSLFLFEMPAIFIVSGYSHYCFEKTNKNELSTFKFYEFLYTILSRFSRILIPYFAYTFICILIVYFDSSFIRNAGNTVDLIFAWWNPFNYGEGYSKLMLSGHLWFIPVFLITTFLMPLITRVNLFHMKNLYLYVIFYVLVLFVIGKTQFMGTYYIKTCLFYMFYSLFGFYLAKRNSAILKNNYESIIIVSFLFLGALIVLKKASINMQINKFPPNYVFFLFSMIWVSLFIIAWKHYSKIIIKLENFYNSFLLRPFIKCGYSIYLWQGLGYSVSYKCSLIFNFNKLSTWILACFLSVFLGVLASPLEKIRMRF